MPYMGDGYRPGELEQIQRENARLQRGNTYQKWAWYLLAIVALIWVYQKVK